MNEKVTMQSPEGETREVDANGPDLVPLMVQGWVQAAKKADAPAPAKPEPSKPADLLGKK